MASKTNKHKPTYYLSVTDSTGTTRQIQAPFTTWFTADGFFVAKPFQQWLARSVGAIGEADAKNAVSEEKSEGAVPVAPTPQIESFAEENGSVIASGVDGKAKGGKRAKRKG